MSILICGLGLFAVAFLLHILIWRLKRPANSVKTLITLFSSVLVSGIIGLLFLGRVYPQSLILPQDSFASIYIAVFFYVLFLVYLLSFPAIEADSPSLVIMMNIHRAGKAGLAASEIKAALKDDLMIGPRLKDLLGAGLIDADGSHYKINKKGVLFLLPFVAYRNFLGLGKGG